ncbi:OmpA family protein [Pedobacter sp. SD-b]|uniref:OmpA family protein n=1 Tax=Pedobacter segetis TaxID=2793069 RepID=A0ABS1BKD4_9SPHI|nr:OmpA family protein [Pedobacter segetis]MBK0383353.1 OmpA family protein [Pedobacter segetis]
MKKSVLIAVITLLFLSSCVVLSKKKYEKLIAQKDSLSTGWDADQVKVASLQEQIKSLQTDTANLRAKIADYQTQLEGLNSNYATLRNNTSSEINKLSADLEKREARLKEVEEILKKRDAATNALKEKLQQALLGFQQSGLTVEIRNGKVYVSLTDKLLFSTGSIVIDDKGKQALKELAKVLNTQPEINIAVEGHTDNQKVGNLGQIKDNWDLSVLRATSVVRYLTELQNISPERLTATGKGQYQPIALGNTPEDRSKNRRIEIVLSPKLDELYNLIK